MRPRPKMLGAKTAVTIHDFSARLGTGEERPLADYRGLLIGRLEMWLHATVQRLAEPLHNSSHAALKSLPSHATSSVIRNLGQTRRSLPSAKLPMA